MKLEREFFYDEVRDGFYIPGIMKRAWGAGLTILSEVDRICKKYNIPYYAFGGTLIGAVRDRQFIPWDDDIDICMKREDFQRFCRIVKEELPEELGFRFFGFDKDHTNFTSVVDKKHMGFQSAMLRKYKEYPYAVTLDIFVLDELANNPEDEEYRKILFKMFTDIHEIIKKRKKSKLLWRELTEIESLLKIQFDRERPLEPQLYFIMDQIFQEFNGGGGDFALMGTYAFEGRLRYPHSAFDKTKFISFYQMQLPIPEGYDEVLRTEFGDYHKKVKAGGEHTYPSFKGYEKQLREEYKDKWIFTYHFSEEDLEHPVVGNFRNLIIRTVEEFTGLHKELYYNYTKRDIPGCLSDISNLQEQAIVLGKAIERKKGEQAVSISIIEQYCEALYQAYMALSEVLPVEDLSILSATVHKELKQTLKKPLSYLKKLRLALEKDFKRQVVFLPHSAKHFESLRPLVDALLEAGDTECKIIPIPYYDRYGDGSLKEMHYEGDDFPKEYEITDYRHYNFEAELPDCIVINSPYDQFNQVWTVDPAFYSREIKKYTNKLVYIPWFVTDEINPKDEEDGKAFYNMKYYVEVPGIFHSDLSIVQSEGMKKAYLSKISQFAGTAVRKKMSKKISGAGSCLLGEKEGKGSKGVVERFRRFLFKA
ncbi:LicD family protein [Oribacterium parvum]|uniref:LicD family protein n=1 Tax=Oribacterium parvum TaxID=1501329 RepID=UPI0028EE43E4|nr:LicD family protein [Oribacterium parvum]